MDDATGAMLSATTWANLISPCDTGHSHAITPRDHQVSD
jgi:hypothetical protein